MKYLRIIGLLAIATAALGGAASASATTFTSPSGTAYTGHFEASNEGGHVEYVTGLFGVTCGSTISGTVKTHGEGTVNISLTNPPAVKCTENVDVEIGQAGQIRAHALSGGDATLTWSFLVVKLSLTSYGLTCTYSIAEGTDVGTLTSSETTGGKATLDLSAKLPQTAGSAFCGEYLQATGAYAVNSPEYLSID